MSILFDENGCRRRVDHGRGRDPAISAWKHMISRCLTPTDYDYASYGGRGIKVCEAWHDANVFCDWAAESGYRPGLTIDRIDNDGDYTPENCRWSTIAEQSRNRRSTRWITVGGKRMTLTDAARQHGRSRHTVFMRLKKGWSIERALTEPPQNKRSP